MHPFHNFELPGFSRVSADTLADADRTVIQTVYFDLVPDLPVGLGDVPLLQRAMTLLAAHQGSAVVETDVTRIGGQPAVSQILKIKLPNQPQGQAFLGSFIVPKANSSAVLRVQAVESGNTGAREAAVMGQVGPQAFFKPHPFAPDVQLPLPFHAADDPAYDAQFPSHPLSRVRRVMAQLSQQVTLQPEFASLPPFAR